MNNHNISIAIYILMALMIIGLLCKNHKLKSERGNLYRRRQYRMEGKIVCYYIRPHLEETFTFGQQKEWLRGKLSERIHERDYFANIAASSGFTDLTIK